MRRRDFIALIGGGVTARPLLARAQQTAGLRRIGLLMASAEDSAEYQGFFAAFRAGLRDLGWIDGRNLAIDTRWCGFNKDLTQQFAKELVARQPELIVSSTTPTTAALQQQTRTIPIVFVSLVDPIGSGFVDSLPRPGGNLTGFINNESTVTGKWLELLKEIAPGTARAAILFNPMTAPYAEYFLKTLRAIRSASGIEAIATPVHDKTELESVVADFARQPDGGLVVLPDSVHHCQSRGGDRAGSALPSASHLALSPLQRTRRPIVLWCGRRRKLSACGELHRSHLERSQAQRATRPGPGEVRTGHQFQNR